jgi:hypothetical protein
MKKYVRIVVDTNDADYVETLNEITDNDLAAITPVIEAIKTFEKYTTSSNSGLKHTHYHNFPTNEALREDLGEKSPEQLYVKTGKCTKKEFEKFCDLLPYSEYGFHTIEKIEILVVSEIILLYPGRK